MTVGFEFKAFDVNAFDSGHQVANLFLLCIFVRKELGSQFHQTFVDVDVDGPACFGDEMIEADRTDPRFLLLDRERGGDDEQSGDQRDV